MDARGVLRCVVAGCLLAMALALAGGCGEGGETASPSTTAPQTTTIDAATRAALLDTGRRVFDKQCSFCHRLNGRRAPRDPRPDAYGSSFDEIETSESFVAARVRRGFGGMQSFEGELSPRQIRAVATYVVANQGSDVDAPPPSQAQLSAGERVFVDRCQRCHSIADRTRTHNPGWRATNFRIVKPSTAFVESVLDGTGNAFMLELMEGIQGKLTQREIRDVAVYVNALATPGVRDGG